MPWAKPSALSRLLHGVELVGAKQPPDGAMRGGLVRIADLGRLAVIGARAGRDLFVPASLMPSEARDTSPIKLNWFLGQARWYMELRLAENRPRSVRRWRARVIHPHRAESRRDCQTASDLSSRPKTNNAIQRALHLGVPFYLMKAGLT